MQLDFEVSLSACIQNTQIQIAPYFDEGWIWIGILIEILIDEIYMYF